MLAIGVFDSCVGHLGGRFVRWPFRQFTRVLAIGVADSCVGHLGG